MGIFVVTTSIDAPDAQSHAFQADVSRLLHLMVHSIYSDRDIFLRELISNGADACEKLRYEALANPGLIGEESPFAIELTLDWVTQRKAFGATLWDKQSIRHRLAMLSARVEAARALIYNTAWRDAQGQTVTKEVSMIKALAGELVNEVMYDCLQFHGGFGYMRESAIERMARDARIQSIGGGATEVMLEEIAKRMV